MKLGFITVMVRDLERSVGFYERVAGLKVIRRFNPGPGEIVFMADGEGEPFMELIGFEKAEKVTAEGMVISFSCTEDLNAVRNKAVCLGYCPTEVFSDGPEPINFKVKDPDGITVEFFIEK